MTTFVLVHGGGHGGWCYQPVARLLRAQGHEVYTPTMTGLGEREHLLSTAIDLDMQIADIVKVLQYEDLKDVILVGHSYGGMIITGVADRATDRVGHIVYLDAAMPQNGQSLVDVAGPFILAARADGKVVDGVELVLFPGKDPMGYFGVTDPAQIEWMKPKLTPHPWKCFEQKLVLNNEAAMRKIPVSVLACSSYLTDEVRAVFRAMSAGRFWEIDTGHDLMITEPQKVADAFLEIAKA
jgi:pimeloyl-ACP methyl ester carboxylesterase